MHEGRHINKQRRQAVRKQKLQGQELMMGFKSKEIKATQQALFDLNHPVVCDWYKRSSCALLSMPLLRFSCNNVLGCDRSPTARSAIRTPPQSYNSTASCCSHTTLR